MIVITRLIILLLLAAPAAAPAAAQIAETRPAPAQASEATLRLPWTGAPVPVELTVGVERRIRFQVSVRVGVPGEIQPSLRTQSADGVVYWLASAPFASQRVQVQEVESGAVYLIDLSADDNKTQRPPIEITAPARQSPPEQVLARTGVNDRKKSPEPDFVTLTRFAAQQLYAPARLLKTPPGVHRAPVAKKPVNLVRGLKVEALPVAAWRTRQWHVTAIRLRNLSDTPVVLDPRTLRGTWRTATFQHARLLPVGNESDTTALYLISDRPFREAL